MPERENIIRILEDVSEEQYFVIAGFHRCVAGLVRIKGDYPHLVCAGLLPIFFDKLGRLLRKFRVRYGESDIDSLVFILRLEIGEHLFRELRIILGRGEAERARFFGVPAERLLDNPVPIDGVGKRKANIFSLRRGLLF